MKWRTIQNAIWAIPKRNERKTCLVYWSACYIFDGMLFKTHVSGYFWIRNLSFLHKASVHLHPVNPAYESALQSWNFLIRYESWIVWTLNPDIFLIQWRDKIEPSSLPWILYLRWQPRSQVVSLTRPRRSRRGHWERGCSRWLPPYDACSVVNIPRGVLGTRVNPGTCRIRVDG